MELLIFTILFLSSLAFIYIMQEKRDVSEKERFREFVIAIKSQNIVEYKEAIPEEGELPVEEPGDELVELDQIDPKTLLKAISKD